jgi:hypothetical protein
MPTYDYRCADGHKHERFESMKTAPPSVPCEQPGCTLQAQKQIGAGQRPIIDNFVPQKLWQLPPDPKTGQDRVAHTKRERDYHAAQCGYEVNQGMSSDQTAAATKRR